MTQRHSLLSYDESIDNPTGSNRKKHSELLNGEFDTLTFDTWVAPRSFGGTGNVESIIEKKQRGDSAQKGFAFGVASYGQWTIQVGTGDSWEELWVDDDPLLPINEWSHLTAVFDGSGGAMRLYLDGERVAETPVEAGSSIKPAEEDLLLGVNANSDRIGAFPVDVLNAAIASLDVYDRALDDEAVAEIHEESRGDNGDEDAEIDYQKLSIPQSHWEDDNHRPEYHVIPPSHWMNEPHAPMYYDGKYHLFYQRNPKGPYWHHIHWGHWVSDDLVRWRTQPDALRPERGIDPEGCWSGDAAYDENGNPVLFYTAGDNQRTPNQFVARADPADLDDPNLVEWEKQPEPVITQPDEQGLRANDFRDPYIFQNDDEWFALVSAGFESGGGTALVFRSPDMNEWAYEGHLHRADHDKYPYLGDVWELPVLLPVSTDDGDSEKHAFFISPVGEGADVEVFYWVGEWDPANAEFTPDHEEPRLLDYGGSHFTGPSGMVDPKKGRTVLFTIAQDYRPPMAQYDSGWAHNGGLPAEIRLRNDTGLGLEPIEELESLRTEKLISAESVSLETINSKLQGVSATTVEVRLELKSNGATEYGLNVRKSPDGEEVTSLYYDADSGTIVADRTDSTLDGTVENHMAQRSELVHEGRVDLDGENLSLTLYIDKSMIECYVNRKKSITTRAYPTRDDADGIQLFSNGDAVVESINVWELESSYPDEW